VIANRANPAVKAIIIPVSFQVVVSVVCVFDGSGVSVSIVPVPLLIIIVSPLVRGSPVIMIIGFSPPPSGCLIIVVVGSLAQPIS